MTVGGGEGSREARTAREHEGRSLQLQLTQRGNKQDTTSEHSPESLREIHVGQRFSLSSQGEGQGVLLE